MAVTGLMRKNLDETRSGSKKVSGDIDTEMQNRLGIVMNWLHTGMDMRTIIIDGNVSPGTYPPPGKRSSV